MSRDKWPKVILGVLLSIFSLAPRALAERSVLTRYYDTQRAGWNDQEVTLTPANVRAHFGWLFPQVDLDEQVDAQPLLAHGVTIGGAKHDVVYVGTANDTVYAIEAKTAEILKTRNPGPAVPIAAFPGECPNNSDFVSINSTPMIDPAASTIFVMAYKYVNNKTPTWILHALDLGTLADKTPPAVVRASALLSDGTPYRFNARVSRQRSALLEVDGNIYAGFGSFCDFRHKFSRGWVLGWQAATLKPLPANRLPNRNTHSAREYFLTGVWMSGSGIATAAREPLFFVTGNSDPTGTSYSPVTNLSESVVKLSRDLTTVDGYFTPSDPVAGLKILEKFDVDFGSGGILLLPGQQGTSTRLAVAAGKAGQMYLLNRRVLGGYDRNGVNQVLDVHPIGRCWCAESYFTGPDGIGRVVSSGGDRIMVWKVLTSPQPKLVLESQSRPLPKSAQDGGFFITVSSNGTINPIIWAVTRPVSFTSNSVFLHAYDPVSAAAGDNKWIFSIYTGYWPKLADNSNIVPVVANGRVYVASYKALVIMGVSSPVVPTQAAHRPPSAPPAPAPLPAGEHEIYGTIKRVGDGKMTLEKRDGTPVVVAVADAIDADLSVELWEGEQVRVIARSDSAHVLHAANIMRAKPSPAAWPPDR
jgi:hypothetical protein